CELGPSAVASDLASARAELPWTATSMSISFWMSTSSSMATSLVNSIGNASRPISFLLLLSHADAVGVATRPQGEPSVACFKENNGALEDAPCGAAAREQRFIGISVRRSRHCSWFLSLKVNETSDG